MSQVNPEEVKAFLKEQEKTEGTPEVTTESQMPGHEVVNLDQLQEDTARENAETRELQERAEEARSKLFEPDKASLAHLSAWVLSEGKVKVEVDAQDKALYLKSLLHDVPLELPIKLEIGIEILIKALTNFEFDIIFLALEKINEKQKIVGPAQYASLVQQCAAALQIVKFGDKHMNVPTFEPGKISVEAAAEQLKERIELELGKWAWPKWQTAITALRVFEAKLALCNENARNGNFWQTADAN